MVEHGGFGPGLVLTTPPTVGSGLPVVVRFGAGLRCVPRESLRLIDGSRWPGLPSAGSPEQLSVEQRWASRWLEALRLGTVAYGHEELFTVGRTAELAQIDDDLRATLDQGGACRVFCGAYGVGKSHLLALVAQRAQRMGLAVSRVVLDRQRISACRPRRLHREIVRGLTLPGPVGAHNGLPQAAAHRERAQGIAALACVFDTAVGRGSSFLADRPWDFHAYLPRLLKAWRDVEAASRQDLRRELLYWIAGGERTENRRLRARIRQLRGNDPGPLYALKDYRTVWNQLCYLLSGLSCLIRESGLADGLVLILDEAEMCAAESASDQRHGDRTLTGLCAAALGGRKVCRPDLLRQLGGHQATRDFPPFYRARNHLYFALGLVTRSSGRAVLEKLLPGSVFTDLRPLSPDAVGALLERILRSYGQAFPHFEVGAGFARPLARLVELRARGHSSPRQVVQQALAFLDGARLWPSSIDSFIEECLTQYD